MQKNVVELDDVKKYNSEVPVRKPRKKKITVMEEDQGFDARKLTLPAITIIVIVGFFMWVTWKSAEERNSINGKIDGLTGTVTQLSKTVDKVVSVIDSQKRGISWTQQDHIIWCLKTQIINPAWKCPEVPEAKQETYP